MYEKIAIVGGGIVGSTAAYELSKGKNKQITLFDESTGQASRAAAGIISPWLSQRRNKKWYHLARSGAVFYPELMTEINADDETYQKVGTLLFKKSDALLDKLNQLAHSRREEAQEIGDISLLSTEKIKEILPNWAGNASGLFVSGGARVDGEKLIKQLQLKAQENGATIINERISIKNLATDKVQLQTAKNLYNFDAIILAVGPHLPELLTPHYFSVDIRPQKGQLIVLQAPENWQTQNWPVIMPVGEVDIIPTHHQQIILGATHENDMGFDLTPDKNATDFLLQQALQYLPDLKNAKMIQYKVGTRAYTSDFLPFFGPLTEFSLPNVCVASGLGASGLTTGPFVGKLLAHYFQDKTIDFTLYQQSITNYIQK